MFGIDSGRTLDSVAIEQGLRELCPDLHFDMGAKLGLPHPFIQDRQGVFYLGRHICSMDRGPVPEFKLWNVKEQPMEAQWYEADMEGVSIEFEVVSAFEPGYDDLYRRGQDPRDLDYSVADDGRLLRLRPMRISKVPYRVIRVGWRHTFEALLRRNIPGITRDALQSKFGVDMYRFPLGSVDELVRCMVEDY